MKYFLVLLCVLTMFKADAQTANYADLVLTSYGRLNVPSYGRPREVIRKCFATKCGTAMMITGAGVGIAGGLGLATPWAKNNDPDKTGAGIKTATSVVIGGISLAVVGIVMHVVGQEYDNNHKRHLLAKPRQPVN